MTAASSRIIQRALSAVGPWTTIATVTPAATTYQDTGLTNGTEYFYRIIGVNAEGNGAPSNVASATPASGPSVAFAMSQSDVVPANGGIQLYEFDGTDIAEIGSLYTAANKLNVSVGTLGDSQLVFTDTADDELVTVEFDGSTWSAVGNQLAITISSRADFARLSDARVIEWNSTQEALRAFDWDGTDWAPVGTNLSFGGFNGATTITELDSGTDFCFVNYSKGWVRTYRFNGSTFAQVGNSLSESDSGVYDSCTLADGSTVVVTGDSEIRVYSWDGTDWTREATITGEFSGAAGCCHYSGDRFVVAHDGWGLDGAFRVYEWDGATVSQVGNEFEPTNGYSSTGRLAKVINPT